MRRSAALFICCLSLAVSLSSASIAVAEETTVVGRPTPLPPNVVPTKPHGETIDDKSQYAHCVALARSKPDDGWEEALAWSSLGGGEPARRIPVARPSRHHFTVTASSIFGWMWQRTS